MPPPARPQHQAHVAVAQAQVRVVAGDHQRPADVHSFAASRRASARRPPAAPARWRRSAPAHAEGAFAQRAQHPEVVPAAQHAQHPGVEGIGAGVVGRALRQRCSVAARNLRRRRGRAAPAAAARQRVGRRAARRPRCRPALQQRWAPAACRPALTARARSPMGRPCSIKRAGCRGSACGQRRQGSGRRPSRACPDRTVAQVTQHGAGLHRRQLVLVAQQHHTCRAGSACSSAAIISRCTMDASSTINTSSGSGRAAL
jgi:hypothetical protein